jgi:ribosomal protein L19E
MPYGVLARNKSIPKSIWVTHNHVDSFNNLMKYLVRLRRDGEIDNETFSELVRQAAATFVQSEISERVEQALEGKISINRLLELL